jgi:hypothetical protein
MPHLLARAPSAAPLRCPRTSPGAPLPVALSSTRRWLLAAVASALLGVAPVAAQTVFVNEIHYDNEGADIGEAIEVGAPGGTDLAGWSLVLYNGANGLVYDTLALSGIVPVQQGGYGVLSFAAPGLQNGSPDGLALVDPSNVVVELLSYEGTFVAVGGPADGMTTTDIGVAETASTPVGHSLQRVGSGDEGSDFTWTGPVAASFGLPNDGQTFGDGGPADPKINELVVNHIGTDTHEFVEVLGDADTDYSAYTVLQLEGDGSGAGVVDTAHVVGTTDAGGFWTTGFLANAFENGTLTLLLVETFTGAVTTDLDTDNDGVLDATPWTRIVDCVAISDGGAGDRTYCETVLAPGFDGDPFTPGGASRIPNGTDTDSAADWRRNDFDGEGLPGFGTGTTEYPEAFNTPGAANDAPPPPPPEVPALVINEIDYDQPSTDTAEFVEILNAGAEPASLDGVELVLVNGNGGGAVIYQTIALPDVLLDSGDYFVVCANAANTPSCDLDVSPDTNLIQNGAPDAVALVLGETVIDTVSYEGDTGAPYTEGSGVGLEDSGAASFVGISRFPDGTDTGVNNVDLSPRCITPGTANVAASTNCPPPGDGSITQAEIYEIQGAGLASPLLGQIVETFDNVVTALAPDGFFIQTPDARADADPQTSNGIFVFTGSASTVAVGDVVDVTGTVSEFFDFTEIAGAVTVAVSSSGAPLPAAVTFDVATPSPTQPVAATEYERFEGMRVSIASGVVGGPNQRFGTDPLAEVFITATGERAFREPGILFPGLPGLPVWDGNPEVFELDPDRLGLPNLEIPAGSTFSAEGVLGYEFGGYELWPTSLEVDAAPLPRPVRERAEDEVAIGSLNVFRLFDDVDDPPQGAAHFPELGPYRDDDGADPDYPVRLAKLARYIVEVLRAPDVLAVQEAEKLEVLEDLAAEMALLDPAVVYTAYLVEGNDVGTIDNGFLVRDTVEVLDVLQLGAAETLSLDGSPLHDRPPFLLLGRATGAGPSQPFGVLGLHQRSLGGIDSPSDGPRVRQKRLEQAESVAAMVQAFQELQPQTPLAVVGDFNAFEFTDGYVDVVGHIAGDFDPSESLLSGDDLVDPNLENQVLSLPPEERYSFVFGGSAQVLDHALTSAAMTPFVRGFEYGRGNADAALVRLDDPATPLRSSDHDGFVLFVEIDDDGIPADQDLCPGTTIPEGVPTVGLKPLHYALLDGDIVFEVQAPPGKGKVPTPPTFTLLDTGGCSCEQIIDALGLGQGPRKFGCPLSVMEEWVESVP